MISHKIKICLILLVLFVNAISGYVMKNHPIRLLVDEPEDNDQQLPLWIWILIGVFATVFVLFMIIGLIIWFCCYGRPNRISYVNEEQLIRAQDNQTDQSDTKDRSVSKSTKSEKTLPSKRFPYSPFAIEKRHNKDLGGAYREDKKEKSEESEDQLITTGSTKQ